MKTVFLLVLCTTTFSAGESATTPSPMSCTMDGNITYTGVPDGVKSVASDCGLPTLNVTTHTIVITGCPVDTAVTVNLYNTIVPTPPTPTTHPFMIDGSGALNLTCTQVTNGQTYTVKVQFPGSVTPTVFASEEQISLTMSLTDHNSSTSPTTVALGQTYDLHVSGGGKFNSEK
ncbi:uncharacterized protein LOC110444982, partial [Mizuhopecten yessoensis]|uniref:uncharacterized protein LOC110444982 n=1 Tax=Mizuhopecten yessoensis TaxID=6573 RepID=UPI000B45A623